MAASGSVLTAVHVVVGIPIALAANAVVARLLGPSDFGALALLIAAFSIALVVTDAGVPLSMIQWGAAAEARGDTSEVHRLLSSFAGFKLGFQFPVLAIFGVWLLRADPAWLQGTFLIGLLMLAMTAAVNLCLVMQNRTAVLAQIAIVGNVVLQGAIVVAAWQLALPDAVWVVRLAATIVGPVLALFALDSSRRRAVLVPRVPRNMPVGFWRFGLRIGMANLVMVLVYTRSEIFVLQWYDQTAALGVFALAYGVSQQITTPVDAMLGPLIPACVALLSVHAAAARAALNRLLHFSALLAGFIASVCLAPAYFAVPAIYGPSYSQAGGLLVTLGLVSTLQSAWQPTNPMLFARGKAGFFLRASGVALAVDIAVALATIPFLGVWGAATANIFGQVVSIVLFVREELREQNMPFREAVEAIRAWWLSLPAFGIAMTCGLALQRISSWLALGGSATIGLLAYLAILRGCGGTLDAREREILVDASPRSARRSMHMLMKILGPA